MRVPVDHVDVRVACSKCMEQRSKYVLCFSCLLQDQFFLSSPGRTAGFFQYSGACFGKLFARELITDCRMYAASPVKSNFSTGTICARGGKRAAAVEEEFSPGMRAHRDAYVSLAESAPKLPGDGGDAFCDLWDLSQSPYHISPGKDWRIASTLIRNSRLYSRTRGQMIPPGEYMMLQGIPIPSLLDAHSQAADLYPFTAPFEELFPVASQPRRLAGNGMHVVQVGSTFAFLLGLAAQLRREGSAATCA